MLLLVWSGHPSSISLYADDSQIHVGDQLNRCNSTEAPPTLPGCPDQTKRAPVDSVLLKTVTVYWVNIKLKRESTALLLHFVSSGMSSKLRPLRGDHLQVTHLEVHVDFDGNLRSCLEVKTTDSD